MGLYQNIDRMWFGTEEKMGWIETPQTGADVSSVGQSANATLQNGGGTVRNSWDSHKVYQFSWGVGASPQMVSLIQAYRNGSYGRGYLYFHDPMHYKTNLLPKRWADPSMAANFEAEPLIPDANPTAVPVVSTPNNYPVSGAEYSIPAGYSSQSNGTELFLPIPPGEILTLGAAYSGAGSVYVRTPAGITDIPPVVTDGRFVVNVAVRDQPWARLGLRNTGAAGTMTLVGMTARLLEYLSPDAGKPYSDTNLMTAPSFELPGSTVEFRRNFVQDPRFTTAGNWAFIGTSSATVSAGAYTATIGPTPPTSNFLTPSMLSWYPVSVGEVVSAGYFVENIGTSTASFRMAIFDGTNYTYGPVSVLAAGQSARVAGTATTAAGVTYQQPRLHTTGISSGAVIRISQPQWEKAATLSSYFDPIVGSGDVDFPVAWVGTANASPSIMTYVSAATPLAGYGWTGDNTALCIRSSRWSRSGAYSSRIISRTVTAASYWYLNIGSLAAGTYTVVIPSFLPSAQVSPVASSRSVEYRINSVVQASSEPFPNTAGVHEMRLTFTKTAAAGTHLLLVNQRVPQGQADLHMDDITLVAGTYAGPAFTGYSSDASWSGAANASTSVRSGYTPIDSEFALGPWMTGQGHSGCRFQGDPTVVNYNGVNGGQIGLSAVFQEVGAWE